MEYFCLIQQEKPLYEEKNQDLQRKNEQRGEKKIHSVALISRKMQK